jgi:hypothetical protein
MASADTQENDSTAISLPSSSFIGSNIQAKFDNTRAEAFAGKMLDILNGGTVSLMISIGHQTRLFDVMSKLPPSISEETSSPSPLPITSLLLILARILFRISSEPLP